MKYRRLTVNELKALEKEFIDFLAINTITADDWVEMKKQDPERVDELVEQFSDSILETIMRTTKFLKYRGEKELYTYQCLEDKIVMVGVTIDEGSELSFAENSLSEVTDQMKIFTTEKSYDQNREKEIFEMTNRGCEISDGALFKQLCLAL